MKYKLTITKTEEVISWTKREYKHIGKDDNDKIIYGYPDQVKEVKNETVELVSLVFDDMNVSSVVQAAMGLT